MKPLLELIFSPFPNENSFCLGYWYWTGEVQKSVQSFKDLIHIVKNTSFHPGDVCQAKWDKINWVLGNNVEGGQEGQWVMMMQGGRWSQSRFKFLIISICRVWVCKSTQLQIFTTTPLLKSSKDILTTLIQHHQFTWSLTSFFGSHTRIVLRSDYLENSTHQMPFWRSIRLCKILPVNLVVNFHV